MAKIGTSSHIKKKIQDKDFYIKKKFGQNFLIDQNILKKIVSVSNISKDTLVIEIGPGMGSLTEHLLDKAKRVLAYEIDPDLIPILQESFENHALSLIHADFLDRNIDKDISDLGEDFDRVVVVANLPYYITTPIILKALEESKQINELVVMMQLEVAKRLTSVPSTKDYNSLSVAIQYKTDAKIALKVPKTVFIPAPNVDSAVVQLQVKPMIEHEPNDEEHFFKLVRNSFVQRRKTLVNNLHSAYKKPKDFYITILEELGYVPNIRAENLSVDDYVILSNKLSKTQ
jgi:16S rRNA (adenine1518-N6/adenine1519-N6)-dimethyltransferase